MIVASGEMIKLMSEMDPESLDLQADPKTEAR